MTLLVEKSQEPRPSGHVTPDNRPEITHVRPDTGEDVISSDVDVTPIEPPVTSHHPDVLALEREVLRLRHDAELKELRAELKQVRLQAELDAAQKALVEVNQSNQRLVADLRQNNERLRLEKQDWKDRHDAREAELNALRSAIGIPWWRRLLSMKDG